VRKSVDKAKLKGVLLPNDGKQREMFQGLMDWMKRYDEYVKEAVVGTLASALAYAIAVYSKSPEAMEDGILMVTARFPELMRDHKQGIEARAKERKDQRSTLLRSSRCYPRLVPAIRSPSYYSCYRKELRHPNRKKSSRTT